MYKFTKMQNSDGTWRFEQDGISLIVDGFTIENETHRMLSPEKAIAFLNTNGHIYGVANQYNIYKTIEEFFDMMKKQAMFFKSKGAKPSKDGNPDGHHYTAAG